MSNKKEVKENETKVDENKGEVQEKVTTEVPKKKPIYKKPWFIILAIIVVFILYMNISTKIENKNKGEAISLASTKLGYLLPDLPSGKKGEIVNDSDKSLTLRIYNVANENFSTYVDETVKKGFTVDSNHSSTSYKAKNSDGYSIDLMYSKGVNDLTTMYIDLDAPKDETNTIASTPAPAPTTTTTSTPAPTITNTNTSSTVKSNATGISSDFKAAMDTYESTMNEYVTYMEKYKKNPTDPTLLTQYATVVKKYSEQVEAFKKWKDADLNTEELAYYVDVQSRVSKKLLEVSK